MSSIGALPAGAVNPEDGSLQTTTVLADDLPGGLPEQVMSEYQENLDVSANTPTDIFTYTVPAGKQLLLNRIAFGGDNIAYYVLRFDGVTKDKYETYFSGPMGSVFDFSSLPRKGFPLAAGVVVTVEATHYRPYAGAFHARLQGVLIG